MLLHIVVVLLERKADAVHDSAVCLSVDGVDVRNAADEVHAGEFKDCGLAGLRIDLDLSQI